MIAKDNFVFGIQEGQKNVQDKVSNQDEIINMETKRSAPRNAELWVEFENKVRLHIAMFDKVEPHTSLIPPLGGDISLL